MSLAALFLAEYDRLAEYLGRKTDPATGEDIASEAFARLTGRGEPSGALLWRIALNILTDHQRNAATRPDILTTTPLYEDRRPSARERAGHARSFATLEDAQFRADFDRAFRALPRPLAEAFTLVELRGLTPQAAADILNRPRRTVAHHRDTARAILQKDLICL